MSSGYNIDYKEYDAIPIRRAMSNTAKDIPTMGQTPKPSASIILRSSRPEPSVELYNSVSFTSKPRKQ